VTDFKRPSCGDALFTWITPRSTLTEEKDRGGVVHRVLKFAIGILATAAMVIAHADVSVSATAAARYNDNVGNAPESDSRIADEVLAARIGLYDLLVLDGADTVSAGGDLSGEWFDHLTGLRSASLDASLAFRHKWALGVTAPWTRAALSVGRTDSDAGYRDTTWYRIALGTGKRFTPAFNMLLEYSFEHRSASPGEEAEPWVSADVFSGNAHALALSAEYALGNRLTLNASALWRHGDVVVSTNEYYYSYQAARAIEEDPALGDEYYAYRFIGTTYGARVGFSAALTAHSALSLSYQLLSTHAEGNSYRNSIPELRWDYRY
jgi:hypothetical protein